jgi:hypothetical protein
MSRKQGPRVAEMRPSESAVGSLRSNGVTTGLLLARVACRHRLCQPLVYTAKLPEVSK